MGICLRRGADLHMAQLMPLPSTVFCFSKIQMVLPFWYWLNQVVLDKGPLNGCCCNLSTINDQLIVKNNQIDSNTAEL